VEQAYNARSKTNVEWEILHNFLLEKEKVSWNCPSIPRGGNCVWDLKFDAKIEVKKFRGFFFYTHRNSFV
jgi:hypothetical protein